MPKRSHSWGIEVGSNAIKAIQLVRQGDGIEVADYDILPFKKILTTPDLDVDEAIRDNLRRFFSRHDTSGARVIVSVPGSAAFAKFAKLPPIDPKKISDIVKFEAVQQIPFPIEQVEWDYQVFMRPDSPDVEVGIFAITKDRVMRLVGNYRAAGQSLDGVTLSALAVYNAMAYDMDLTPESPGMIFMDMGTTSTDVIIVEGGNLWLRTLPIGGNNFTEAIVRAFKLSFAKAEKLKREAATSKYSRQIFQAMRPVFTDLIQEMQRTLGYYQSINRDAKLEQLIGVGSCFRLPGIKKFLHQQLQIDVHRLEEFKRIGVEGSHAADFTSHALNLATVYGLALQGLGLERVHANILPSPIIKQRLWQAKQPWVAGAAAALVVASAATWVRLEVDKSQFKAGIAQSAPLVEQATQEANQYLQQWRKIEGGSDPRSQIEGLRRLLDYRDLWPKLMHDLTLATRALDAQPQLMITDYNAIKEIPRQDRRRMYIDSITAQYQFGAAAPGMPASGFDPSVLCTIDQIWPQQQPNPGAEATDAQTAVPGGDIQPPSFLITIKGSTPYRDGPKLIGQHFINWLQENSSRQGRPYRIIASNQAMRRIEKIASSGRTRRATTSRLARNGRTAVQRGKPRTSQRSGANSRTSIAEILDSLLPDRPLADESRLGDWSFEIQWTVQLLRPEEARQAEGARSAEKTSQHDLAAPGTRSPAVADSRMGGRL